MSDRGRGARGTGHRAQAPVGTARAALARVRHSLWSRALLVAGALVVLGVGLVRSPLATAGAAAAYGVAWWLRRLQRIEHHRQKRGRHRRRRIVTTGLVATGIWVAVSVIVVLRDTVGDTADADAPWPGDILVAGIVAIVAIVILLAATLGTRRRHQASVEVPERLAEHS